MEAVAGAVRLYPPGIRGHPTARGMGRSDARARQRPGRGNSGVFLMGKYEIQVLDSYENVTYADGQAGALYGQYPPLVNAGRPAGEWQAYDIIFRRPRFKPDAACCGRRGSPCCTTESWRKDNSEVWGPTSWLQHLPYESHPDRLAAVAARPRQPRAVPQHLAARVGRRTAQGAGAVRHEAAGYVRARGARPLRGGLPRTARRPQSDFSRRLHALRRLQPAAAHRVAAALAGGVFSALDGGPRSSLTSMPAVRLKG